MFPSVQGSVERPRVVPCLSGVEGLRVSESGGGGPGRVRPMCFGEFSNRVLRGIFTEN